MANLRRVREKGVYGRVGRVRRGEHGADSRAGEGGRAVGTGTRDCGDEGRRGERAEETASDSHRGRGLRTALSTLPALMPRYAVFMGGEQGVSESEDDRDPDDSVGSGVRVVS